ncbi:Gfo/Idh/MocA family protein [Actinomadura rifamycini]|uniref:Gfo/Idh/MocA family protein n=1 Tax=Actinomadura rifamycini TaxID=31962 RepID=UPI00041365DE|nr:Gfo/Idh/MocA family oxidoreductase [Actinomadura rifamycini]
MDEIRFGVLGCADIAARKTIPAIAAAGHRVTAVASRDGARAERFATRFGAAGVAGYAALLDRGDVDAVYVPLPLSMHAEWTAAALRAGKHVLVEKSLTGDAGTARDLVALARGRGLLLMENFAFLHHAQHDAVRRLIADGAIGEVRSVTAEFGIPPGPPDAVRYDPALGGGCLLETGTYPVRAAQLFLGPDAEVAGAALRRDDRGIDVDGAALLRDGAGVTAHCTFGFDHHYRCAYAVWGSAGRIALDWAFTPPPTVRPVLRLERRDLREERVLDADDQFRGMVSAFAAAVRTGEHAPHGAAIERQARLLEDVRTRAGGTRAER